MFSSRYRSELSLEKIIKKNEAYIHSETETLFKRKSTLINLMDSSENICDQKILSQHI